MDCAHLKRHTVGECWPKATFENTKAIGSMPTVFTVLFPKLRGRFKTSFMLSGTQCNDMNVVLTIIRIRSIIGQKKAFLRWIWKEDEDTQIYQTQHPKTESKPAPRNQLPVEAYESPSGKHTSRIFHKHFLKTSTVKALVLKAYQTQTQTQTLKLDRYCESKTRCSGMNTLPEKLIKMILRSLSSANVTVCGRVGERMAILPRLERKKPILW